MFSILKEYWVGTLVYAWIEANAGLEDDVQPILVRTTIISNGQGEMNKLTNNQDH